MSRIDRRRFLGALCAAAALPCALAWPGAARADDDDDDDHDKARKALERGEILPLNKILKRLGTRIAGKIVRIKLEREDGAWVYEIKYVSAKGRVIELEVDAKTGKILKTEGDE